MTYGARVAGLDRRTATLRRCDDLKRLHQRTVEIVNHGNCRACDRESVAVPNHFRGAGCRAARWTGQAGPAGTAPAEADHVYLRCVVCRRDTHRPRVYQFDCRDAVVLGDAVDNAGAASYFSPTRNVPAGGRGSEELVEASSDVDEQLVENAAERIRATAAAGSSLPSRLLA